MASYRPFRTQSPHLRLALTPQISSPRLHHSSTATSSHSSTPLANPVATNFAKTTHSPFLSANPNAPLPYGSPVSFSPRRSNRASRYGKIAFLRLKRSLRSRALWLMLVFSLLMIWWFKGGSDELDAVKLGAAGLGRDFFQEGITKGMQFFPAANPKIHACGYFKDSRYVGRWTAAPNRLRKDGAFPGVYFDIIVQNTTSIFLSLHNVPMEDVIRPSQIRAAGSIAIWNTGFPSFHQSLLHQEPAPPLSLLARIDQEAYILLPNASALVFICSGNLEPNTEHQIRVVAPMTDSQGGGVFELEGIWLSKGGRFERVEGSMQSEDFSNEDDLHAQSDQVGERHRSGLREIISRRRKPANSERQGVLKESNEILGATQERRKTIEIITDTPGASNGNNRSKGAAGADALLAGVMGWEYLLGEMFSVDHVGISMEGMCLVHDCIGSVGQPAGVGDTFFRSGPSGSAYFKYWSFNLYIPDVIVINLGSSDHFSFEQHSSEYNKTAWDLSERFETAYISLVTAIRTLAYPKHPTVIYNHRSASPSYIPNTIPATIPIFVMRPFRGKLEHATQNVVTRLRANGDKQVFWLDTSDWLDPYPSNSATDDFFLLDSDGVDPPKWRLTIRGNRRAAIFLHMHVCRYLARRGDRCPFLPPEVYTGKMFDPKERDFDRYVEHQKERKLRSLFWGEGDEAGLLRGLEMFVREGKWKEKDVVGPIEGVVDVGD